MNSPDPTPLPGEITLIDTEFFRPGLAASYLLEAGGRAAFIESGPTNCLDKLRAALRFRNVDPASIDFLIVTHVHLDHAGGAGVLLEELPNAKLVVHPRGARHMVDPAKLIAGATAVYGEEVLRQIYGEIRPVPAERLIEAADDFSLEVGGRLLRFLDTPGHAKHHFSVYDETTRGVFTGDTFGLSFRKLDTKRGAFLFPTTTPVQFDPEAMHRSVDRLMALNPETAYLTHFGPVTELLRLAAKMHIMIDRFVELAIEHAEVPNRQSALSEKMSALLHREIREHGCELTKREIDDVISMDVALNVQGLEVWLDRRSRQGP